MKNVYNPPEIPIFYPIENIQISPNVNSQPVRKTRAQGRAKAIANIDFVLNMLATGFALLFLTILIYAYFTGFKMDPDPVDTFESGNGDFTFLKIIMIFAVTYIIVFIVLNFYLVHILRKGAENRDYRLVNRWIIIEGIFFSLFIFGEITRIVRGQFNIVGIIWFLYRGITIGMVWELKKELKEERNTQNVVYNMQQGTPGQYPNQGPSGGVYTEPPPPSYYDVV